MLNNKGQGAIEYLLIIGGVIILAIIVIFIIVSTGSSSRDTVDTSQERMDKITDSAIFPPRIKSSACSYREFGLYDTTGEPCVIGETDCNTMKVIDFNLTIFESPTPEILDYCYIIDGNSTLMDCVLPEGNKLNFTYLMQPQDDNAFAINLVARSYSDLISNPSVVSNCYIR